jgi:hypothetical protein
LRLRSSYLGRTETISSMKTREEAVAFLISRGVHAKLRNSASGTMIFAATGASTINGLDAYQRAMYIAPKGEGWVSFELDHARAADEDTVSLAHACERVVRTLSVPAEREGGGMYREV